MVSMRELLAAALPDNAAGSINYAEEEFSSATELFQAVFKGEGQKIFRYINSLVRNREVAEDLTQDVFLKYLRNTGTVHRNAIVAWLFQVAKNTAIDYLRKKKPCFLDPREDGGDPMEVVLMEQKQVEEAYEEQYCNRSFVEAILSRLSDRQNTCLILRIRDGLTVHEIAKLTGWSEGQVKYACVTALVRAREVADELMRSGEQEVPLSDSE